MPSPEQLYEEAKRITPKDSELAGAWQCLLYALQAGWLEVSDLQEIVASVRSEIDYGNDELHLEFLGDRFRVSFLRDAYEPQPGAFASLVYSLLARVGVHPGTVTIMEGDKVLNIRKADEVPEKARFADSEIGPLPVVKVVMQMMSDSMREIVEYGPNGERLRSTIQTKG